MSPILMCSAAVGSACIKACEAGGELRQWQTLAQHMGGLNGGLIVEPSVTGRVTE